MRVGKSPGGIAINNTTTVIVTIGNRLDLGEILEELWLSPYESWE